MRSKEAHAANPARNIVQDSLGDSHAVVRGRPAAELVEDDEAAGRRFGQDFLGLRELDEEGGLGGEDVVVCAEARHYAVDGGQGGRGAGEVAADLGEDDCYACLGMDVSIDRESEESWGM